MRVIPQRVSIYIGLALFIIGPLVGQGGAESAPESRGGLDGLRAAMSQLRDGPVDIANLKLVVEQLAGGGHVLAAQWWITVGEEASKGRPAAEREAVGRLARMPVLTGSFPEERKLMSRLVRQTESLIADKDFERAGKCAAIVRSLLLLIPDATVAKALESAAKRLASENPATTASRLPAEVELHGAAAFAQLIESALRDYREAGCRPGRRVLTRVIREAAKFRAADEVAGWRSQLRELTKPLEPGLALRLFLRTSGTVHIYCEGRPITVGKEVAIAATTQPPFDVPALPGDRVTIVLDEPYAVNPGTGQIFFVGLNGRWDSAGIDPKRVFSIVEAEPLKPGLALKPAPLARKRTNPPESMFGKNGAEYDEALRTSKTWFSVNSGANVPGYADVMSWQSEFATLKLVPVWFGDEMPEGSHLALIIVVPED